MTKLRSVRATALGCSLANTCTKVGNILFHAVKSQAVRLIISNMPRAAKELFCFDACELSLFTSTDSRTCQFPKTCFAIHSVLIEDSFDRLKNMAEINGVKIPDSPL
ncbi:uncharacterized protein BROUX77_002572 [Berkeleyomyces rouxiae]|uniref:uncharacterized protein n=1 Tax=Berkeleyomyces rouxiae TaxID=2035830 RepID=UPI003B80E0D7